MAWWNVLGCLAAAAGMSLASRSLIHYFQLESYQFPGFFRTLRRNARRAMLPGALLTLGLAACVGIALMVTWPRWLKALLTGALLLASGGLMGRFFRDAKSKKPLVLTPRVKRLYAVMTFFHIALLLLLGAGIQCGLNMPGAAASLPGNITWVCLALSVLYPCLLPLWTALSGLIAWPIEKLISEMYFRDAQRILRQRPDLIKIGITGSYGKTSVKFILGTLLSEKYQTLVTPSSFNTPMGVTKIIRTKLMPAHQVFVAEMGARHVGDIKEMCRLVHPDHGVLTSIGPQHLETFHSIEHIKRTKYELMDAVPQGGCCFFPDDGGICRALYEQTAKEKRLCAVQPTPEADVWAEDIRVSPQGSSFLLCTREEKIPCETKLLGEHNIQNILLAATVCLRLQLTLRQIARGISRLSPVDHRLQLIPSTGVTIIDDAFNSNPRGAEAALDVIRQFPGRRIIITPGMVELGDEETAFNRAFGQKMASAVDMAILVGRKHTQPIHDGLREAGFPEDHIHPVANLEEAAALLRQLGRPGDVALFENDLPDNYSES